jgi:hypothetical protein
MFHSHILIRSIITLCLTAGLQAHPIATSSYTNTSTTRHHELVVSHVAFLGDVHSKTTYVVRDLGFQGQIGPYILLTYGDTIFTDRNYKNDTFRGMTSDSMALATHDPLQVVDPALDENGYPRQFCPLHKGFDEDPSECALGITNVIETSPGEGIIFFLLNHRPGGINNLRGAGVATVTLSNTYPPIPNVTRLSRYWWDGDTEPWYGDVCALRHNNYIYAYGHAKDDPFVYLARVHWESVTRLDCYEYWNGEGWQKQRPKTTELGEKASMFWQVNQGQVMWSPYFGCFLFVYCGMCHLAVTSQICFRPAGDDADADRQLDELESPRQNSASARRAVVGAHYTLSGHADYGGEFDIRCCAASVLRS